MDAAEWKIRHPDMVMRIAYGLAHVLEKPCPPPAGGYLNHLPEAFAALDEHGEVLIIGYQGESYTPIKLSPITRLHNWLISIGNRRIPNSDAS